MAEVNGKKKDAYYFTHDSNASQDVKIMRLRHAHNWAGYGIYWAIIEKLRDQKTYKLAEKDIPLLAHSLHCDLDVMKSVIYDFDLFAIGDNEFYSNRLTESMEIYNSLKQKKIDGGRKGGLRSASSRASSTAKAELQDTSSSASSLPQALNKGNKGNELKKGKEYPPDSAEIRLASLLRDFLFSEDEKTKAPNLQKWANEIGLMMRVDGLGVGEIENVIRWAKKDGCWWCDKILSTANLRKHAEKIRRQMKEEIGKNGGGLKKGDPVDFGKLGEEFDRRRI